MLSGMTLHLSNLQELGGDAHLILEARFISRSEIKTMNVYPRELQDDLWTRIQQSPVHPIHLGTQEEGIDVQF